MKEPFEHEMPCFGIISHSSNGADEHTHEIYLMAWDGVRVHVHHFSGVTSYDDGHVHRYAGTTEPALSGVPHTHRYMTVSSMDDGHTHTLHGVTGPAIPVPGGGHVHYFEGVTTVNGLHPHTHRYRGRTGE